MGFVLFVVVAWLLQVCASQCNLPRGEDRRPDRTVLRVGTFNLAWLFAGFGQYTNMSPWKNSTAAEKHIEAVAKQILRTRVDVLAVHEVRDCAILSRLVGYLGRSYRYFLVPGTDTATGQNSALVTRLDPTGPLVRTWITVSYPIQESRCRMGGAIYFCFFSLLHRRPHFVLFAVNPSTTGVSKHAIARITASTFSFDFIFAHFKSGSGRSNCAQREAQAKVIRTYLTTKKHSDTIVAGDLNDWDDSFPDAFGATGTSRTLFVLKGRDLVNAGQRLSVMQRASAPIGLIDHVLVGLDLEDRVMNVSCDGTGYPLTSAERIANYLSDHLPVVVTLSDVLGGGTYLPGVTYPNSGRPSQPPVNTYPTTVHPTTVPSGYPTQESGVEEKDAVLLVVVVLGIGLVALGAYLVARIRIRQRREEQPGGGVTADLVETTVDREPETQEQEEGTDMARIAVEPAVDGAPVGPETEITDFN